MAKALRSRTLNKDRAVEHATKKTEKPTETVNRLGLVRSLGRFIAQRLSKTDPEAPLNPLLPEVEVFQPSNTMYTIECGNKSLNLHLPFMDDKASTNIINRIGRSRIPGATTAVYTKANELMQAVADNRGEPFIYEIRTKSPEMRSWVLTQGQEIFDLEVIFDDQLGFLAQKTFIPEGYSQQTP